MPTGGTLRLTCTPAPQNRVEIRVQDTGVGSRQLGRRGIVTFAAIVVRPDSAVFTPQQLAGKSVAVPFYFGTHYLALHLLEGFMPRDMIKLICARTGISREDAYTLCSLAADLRVTQTVNGAKGIHVMLAKADARQIEDEARYEKAGATFGKWLKDEVLVQDKTPCIYYIKQEYKLLGV